VIPKLILKIDVAANIVEGLKAEINGDKEDRLSKINQKIRDDSTPTFDEDKLKISLRDPSRPT
jgi:hypothetical protein